MYHKTQYFEKKKGSSFKSYSKLKRKVCQYNETRTEANCRTVIVVVVVIDVVVVNVAVVEVRAERVVCIVLGRRPVPTIRTPKS